MIREKNDIFAYSGNENKITILRIQSGKSKFIIVFHKKKTCFMSRSVRKKIVKLFN